MRNRVTAAISVMKAQIEGRIAMGLTTPERVAASAAGLDMEVEEHADFQTRKSLAVELGKLTLDEGMTVYVLLGNTVSVFNRQPAHVKSVLTGLFRELLEG